MPVETHYIVNALRPLRIGIDGGTLANRRGFGRFARELLVALSRLESPHEFVVLLDQPTLEAGLVQIPKGFELVSVAVRDAPSQAASARGRRRLGDLFAMGRAAAGTGLDVLYFPSTYSFFPVWNVGRVVTTIFDTMPLDHPGLIFPTARHSWAWRVKERMAVWASDQIVTTSEFSRSCLMRHYGLVESDVTVVPCAPSSVFRPIDDPERLAATLKKYQLPGNKPLLLYVGGLSPHKNLTQLIRAFAGIGEPKAHLVLVGDFADVFHTHIPELRRQVAELSLADRVSFTGFVDDSELAVLYNAAYALVQPSLVEGFGLPPVEAMACGLPVLASTAGSLPEVVGDAGLMFDPTNLSQLTSALRGILTDAPLRRSLAAAALERAKAFRWETTACRVLETLECAASRRAIERAG
jgi:glycosyltransferase involved in cell wall biosynthesis